MKVVGRRVLYSWEWWVVECWISGVVNVVLEIGADSECGGICYFEGMGGSREGMGGVGRG